MLLLITINGRPKPYTVEWWHTYESKVIEKKRLSLTQGALRISVPPFSRDIACKIRMTK